MSVFDEIHRHIGIPANPEKGTWPRPAKGLPPERIPIRDDYESPRMHRAGFQEVKVKDGRVVLPDQPKRLQRDHARFIRDGAEHNRFLMDGGLPHGGGDD